MNDKLPVGTPIKYTPDVSVEAVPGQIIKHHDDDTADVTYWNALYGSNRQGSKVPHGVQAKGHFWLGLEEST